MPVWRRRFASSTSRSPANSQRIWRQAPHGGVGSSVSATTETRRNFVCPSESALNIATRSAQMVRPYVAFSMLQPVMIIPSAVSSAAPTLNPENRACAFRRAFRAAAINAFVASLDGNDVRLLRLAASDTLDNPFKQRDERPAHEAGRLHHLGVIQRLRQHTRGHVGDARDPEHLETHVTGGNRFGYGRDPDRIGPDRTEDPDLRRRFINRPMPRHV